jgi:hypothetical protein
MTVRDEEPTVWKDDNIRHKTEGGRRRQDDEIAQLWDRHLPLRCWSQTPTNRERDEQNGKGQQPWSTWIHGESPLDFRTHSPYWPIRREMRQPTCRPDGS